MILCFSCQLFHLFSTFGPFFLRQFVRFLFMLTTDRLAILAFGGAFCRYICVLFSMCTLAPRCDVAVF